MDFFIQNAYAQNAQAGGGMGTLFFMIAIFVLFYFMLIRPQQKKQKAHAALVAALKEGDEVITAGGILGKITGVSEHYVVVKVADNTELKMQKSSVAQVVPNDTFDNA